MGGCAYEVYTDRKDCSSIRHNVFHFSNLPLHLAIALQVYELFSFRSRFHFLCMVGIAVSLPDGGSTLWIALSLSEPSSMIDLA
jgi:hypothetical protein